MYHIAHLHFSSAYGFVHAWCLWNIKHIDQPQPYCGEMICMCIDLVYHFLHNEGSRPEWCISSMIYSRDTPFWLGTLGNMFLPQMVFHSWFFSLSFSLSLPLWYTLVHTHTHTHIHAHTSHTQTHQMLGEFFLFIILFISNVHILLKGMPTAQSGITLWHTIQLVA